MKIKKGKGQTEFGTGINIELSGDEVAHAIATYIFSKRIYIFGARTIRVNGEKCESASVYVDPSGDVIQKGIKISGRTGKQE